MIRGYFSPRFGRQRPFITAPLEFPSASEPNRELVAHFLIDTGADRTVLARRDVEKLTDLGVVLEDLPPGPSSTGIGGRVRTRVIDAIIRLNSRRLPLAVVILEPLSGPVASHVPSFWGETC